MKTSVCGPARAARLAIIPFALLVSSVPAWCGSIILSDDLSNANFSYSIMTTSLYDAVQINTDANTYTVTQATLVLQASDQIILTDKSGDTASGHQEIIGSGQLSIYDATGAGGQPVNNLGTFTGPGTLTTTLSNNVFNDAGIVLQPNTEYWLVFQVLGGTVNWGIDANGSSGTGPLFDGSYSDGTLGGGFNDLIFYPSQTQLVGTETIATVGTPEPATLWLTFAGLAGLLFWRGSKSRITA